MNREDYERLAVKRRLTDRQLDVAVLAAQGLSNKEVGARLFLTEQTIKFHLTNAYQKLHVTNRIALLHAMVRIGLIPCPLCAGEDREVIVDGRRYVPDPVVVAKGLDA